MRCASIGYRSLFALAVSAATALHPAAAKPPQNPWKVVDIGTLRGGYSFARGMNDRGEVVGESDGRAFLWRDGKMRDLGTLEGFTGSQATAVNDRGDVVGYASAGREGQVGWRARAFLWSGGKMRDLGALDGDDSRAFAVNAAGQVAGQFTSPKDGTHAFLWDDDRMRSLGGSDSCARGVNSRGQVVGWEPYINGDDATVHVAAYLWESPGRVPRATLTQLDAFAYAIANEGSAAGQARPTGAKPGTAHAFLASGTRSIDLGTLGGNESCALALNNAQQVVGYSDVPPSEGPSGRHAFLWEKGKMSDLNALLPPGSGWVLTEAHAIDARGRIAGEGRHEGRWRAFLATPGPAEAARS